MGCNAGPCPGQGLAGALQQVRGIVAPLPLGDTELADQLGVVQFTGSAGRRHAAGQMGDELVHQLQRRRFVGLGQYQYKFVAFQAADGIGPAELVFEEPTDL